MCRKKLTVIYCAYFCFSICISLRSENAKIAIDYDQLFSREDYPLITYNDEELIRLRQAMVQTNEEGKIVQQRISEAQKNLSEIVEYPPRGGKHNQWYQCDKCEIALVTVDKHHHKCPKCGTVYSGEPYDDVLFDLIHYANLTRMLNSSLGYILTAKEAFAQDAISILTNYATLYLTYPRRGNAKWNVPYALLTGARLSDQTLDEAYLFATKIAPAFDLVYNSSLFTEESKSLVREKFFAPLLENIKQNWANPGNWQSWHNAALFMGGVLLKRKDFIEHSLYHPKNGFFAQMEKCVTLDGMWFENSWAYHFYALQALVLQAEAARRVGIDLWQNTKLKKMFLMPLLMVMPDGSLPRFGDDVSSSLLSQSDLYEIAFNYYKDNIMQAVLPQTHSFYSIMFGRKVYTHNKNEQYHLPSVVFTNSGYVVMRTYGEKNLTVAATFSPFGGYHSHFDKLSFVFFGFNRELGVDPGRAASQAYRLPIHKKWYRATISHNTIVVDGKSQKPAKGNLEFFYATNNLVFAVLSCNEHYNNLEQKRLFILTDSYLVVADKLKSSKERCFDWFYHNRATNVTINNSLKGTFVKPSNDGWQYINLSTSGIAYNKISLDFLSENCSLRIIMPGEGTLFIGDGPGHSITERIPLTAVRKTGREVFFLASFEPTTNNMFSITNINWQPVTNGIIIEIEGNTFTNKFNWLRNMRVEPLGL